MRNTKKVWKRSKNKRLASRSEITIAKFITIFVTKIPKSCYNFCYILKASHTNGLKVMLKTGYNKMKNGFVTDLRPHGCAIPYIYIYKYNKNINIYMYMMRDIYIPLIYKDR